MKPAPRPAARLLLAGRFLVPRASLLALPDGPVTGLDLSSGRLVALAFGPGADAAGELEQRIARWNELSLPGCPAVRELRWHLGRPLLAYDPAPRTTGLGLPAGGREPAIAASSALGDALASAGLGLPAGSADLGFETGAPYLRRPAVWPRDDTRPLSHVLAALAGRLCDGPPSAVEADPPRAARLVAPSRRARGSLVLACGVLAAVAVSSLTGPSRGGGVARAAPLPSVVPRPAAVAPVASVPPAVVHVRRAVPVARGGPARELAAAPVVAPVVRAPAEAPRTSTPRAVPPAARGWVDGLFVAP